MCAAYTYCDEKDDSGVYQIDYSNPGVVLIFNNKYFHEKSKVRKGSEQDVMRLTDLFVTLNYTVERFIDTTAAEVKTILKEWSNRDYENIGCLLVFIMSHGKRGTIITTDGKQIILDEFVDPFKRNRSLKNKPKLFFIQACRGSNFISAIEKMDDDQVSFEEDASRVPIEADFLYSYSTIEDFYSFRDEESGSWYIQTLCDIIDGGKAKELSKVLTIVNNRISKKETSDRKKMMSTFENRLTKLFYSSQPVNKYLVMNFYYFNIH